MRNKFCPECGEKAELMKADAFIELDEYEDSGDQYMREEYRCCSCATIFFVTKNY